MTDDGDGGLDVELHLSFKHTDALNKLCIKREPLNSKERLHQNIFMAWAAFSYYPTV